jgi:hypothetical protein
MAILALNRNNKNQYRKFPFKQTSALRSTTGYTIPDDIFVNCSLTATYGRHRIYVKQLFYKAQEIHITVAAISETSEDADEVLGVFVGKLGTSFTTLTLTPFVRFVSGSITLYPGEALQSLNEVLVFNREQTEFEESLIFCYTPPAVTSIQDKRGNELRGIVNFGVLTNLTKTSNTATRSVKFTATAPEAVFNPADKSSFLNNCSTPVIKNINGVEPFPAGVGSAANDGNIYIAGVKPIIFYGVPGEDGVVGVNTEGVTLESLCTQKHKLLPPIDISGFTLDSLEFKDSYYNKPALPKYPEDYQEDSPNYPLPRPARASSNFNSAKVPEYYFWPQFAKEEYYNNYKYWPQIPE